MQSAAFEKYRMILNALQTDPEYLMLEKEYHALEQQLRRVLGALPEKQRHVITEYIGICSEMDMRALEIVCFTL